METTNQTLEDIILSHDHRGIGVLRPHLAPNFCTEAAEYILKHRRQVLITTGLYIPGSKTAETDGPLGALALGNAIAAIDGQVIYLAGTPLSDILANYLKSKNNKTSVIDYPIVDGHEANTKIADEIADKHKPSLLISVERCSPTASGQHLNMRGRDITANTPRIEYLFVRGIPSIGIGDGGNEICMGNFADEIEADEQLPSEPGVITCDRPVIASVSNWGAYAVVAALSIKVKKNLLPTPTEEGQRLEHLVKAGLVDGVSGEQKNKVDGFTAETNAKILTELNSFVEKRL